MKNYLLAILFIFVLSLFSCSSSAQVADDSLAGTITYLAGDVEIFSPGGYWGKAKKGMLVKVGDEIKTSATSYVQMTLHDGTLLRLGESSRYRIKAADKPGLRSILELLIGEIKARVLKLSDVRVFEIHTGACVAGVRGTDFAVTSEDGRASDVEVYEGTVYVESLGKEGERQGQVEIGENLSTRVEREGLPMLPRAIPVYRHIKWKLWEIRKTNFDTKVELGDLQISIKKLDGDLQLSRSKLKFLQKKLTEFFTDEDRAEVKGLEAKINYLEPKVKSLNSSLKSMQEALKKSDAELLEMNKKYNAELRKAVMDWKKLPPAERQKQRLNYDLWQNTQE